MLAEEVDLVSVRWAEPGITNADPVSASIVGTGNLFRLMRGFEPSRLFDACGTSIRLYLRSNSDLSALAASIEKWLGMPEFEVVVITPEGAAASIPARRPIAALASGSAPFLTIPGSEGRYCGPRVLLHPNTPNRYRSNPNDILMVDGIITHFQLDSQTHYNDTALRSTVPGGIIVNFAEDLRADLSVNRERGVPSPDALDFVWDWISRGASKALAEWESPEFLGVYGCVRRTGFALWDLSIALRRGEILWPLMPVAESDFPGFPTAAGLCDADPHILADLQIAGGGKRSSYSENHTVVSLVFENYDTPFRRSTDDVTERVLSNLLLVRLDELAGMGFGPADDALVYLGMPTSKVELGCPFRCADIVCAFGSVINVEDLWELFNIFGLAVDQAYEILKQLAAYGATGTAIGLTQHQLEQWESLSRDHLALVTMAVGPRSYRREYHKNANLNWLHLFAFAEKSKHSLHHTITLARDLKGLGVPTPDLDHPPAIANTEELRESLNLIIDFIYSYGIGETLISFIARQKKLDFTTVYQKLELLKPLGLEILPEKIPEPGEILSRVLNDDDLKRLSTGDLATLNTLFRGEDIFPGKIDLSFILEIVGNNGGPLLQSVVSAVRSVVLLGYEIPCTMEELTPGEIELLDRFIQNARPYSTRVVKGLKKADGPAAWDIGLAAVMLRRPVTELADVIACFEKLGLNIADCRTFIDSRKANCTK
jgi:hypothetical protein